MNSFRPLGLEYYNFCNLYWARLSMDNMDIQFLVNSSWDASGTADFKNNSWDASATADFKISSWDA
ncbi:hypothetical protein HDU78_011881, partial [Chytriomyces hyalinus]